MSAPHEGQRCMIKLDPSGRNGAAEVTLYSEAVQLERKRNSAKQIRHEDQTAIQDCQYGQFAALIILGYLSSQLIEPDGDLLLAVKHSLQIPLHQYRYFREGTRAGATLKAARWA